MTKATTDRPPSGEDLSPATRRRNRRLWFTIAAGPVVYSVYFVAGYLFAETVCTTGAVMGTVLGLEALSFWIVVLTVLAAAVTTYSTVLAFGYWRRLGPGDNATQPAPADDEHGYAEFMAFVGMGLSAIFTFVILLTGAPALFLTLCDWI